MDKLKNKMEASITFEFKDGKIEFPKGEHEYETEEGKKSFFVVGDPVKFVAQGMELKCVERFGISDPTFKILVPGEEPQRVLYNSEVVDGDLNPTWEEAEFFVPPTLTKL